MKKLLIILPLLIACKSTKNADCDAYGSTTKDTIPEYFEILMTTNDTLHLAEEHVHLDEEQLCEWMDAYDYVINDTVRIKLPNAAYKFKNK
jgi:hypothetical protein